MVRTELAELTEQWDSLNARIAVLTRSAESLAVLCNTGDNSVGSLPESTTTLGAPDLGTSDAIRNILAASVTSPSPQLLRIGQIALYQAPLGTVRFR